MEQSNVWKNFLMSDLAGKVKRPNIKIYNKYCPSYCARLLY